MNLCVLCNKELSQPVVILENSYGCHRSCYDAAFPLMVKAIVLGNENTILNCVVTKA